MSKQISSILNSIVLEVNAMVVSGVDLVKIKNYILAEIGSHTKLNPEDKKKMLVAVRESKKTTELIEYLYNALLKYEGLAVIK